MALSTDERASKALLGGRYRLDLAWAIILHGGQKAFTMAEIRGLMARQGKEPTTQRDLEKFEQAGVVIADGEPGDGRTWEAVECDFWDYCTRLRRELANGTVRPPLVGSR